MNLNIKLTWPMAKHLFWDYIFSRENKVHLKFKLLFQGPLAQCLFFFVAVWWVPKNFHARLPIIEVLKRSVLAKGKEDWEVSSKNGQFYMELCGP